MRIILDSNVIISALTTQGLSSRILDICIDKHIMFTSSFIIEEVTRILSSKFKVDNDKITRITTFIQQAMIKIEPTGIKPICCRDDDDNNVLHLAGFINAELIITGDSDLLILQTYKSTNIIKPRQFIERFHT